MLRKAGVERTRVIVEDSIRGLGGDPAKARSGEDTWLVRKGSAALAVRILAEKDPDAPGVLRIDSPIMRVPAAAPAFWERILQLNHDLRGFGSFCVTPQGELHLTFACSARNLSAREVANMLAQLAQHSDDVDDKLLAEFGRELALRKR